MKFIIGVTFCLLCLCLTGITGPTPTSAQEGKKKSEKFSSLAYMPSGAGPAMVGAGARSSVDIYIKSYTSDAEAKQLAAVLLEGGGQALHKALEKADSIGNITLTGRVSFYDLKLIRSHATPNGRQIIAVGDRPIRFLEAYYSGRSTDYDLGIMQINLTRDKKGKEKGEGALIYAAKVKVLEGNKVEIENYGIDPIRLMAVRKL